MQKPIHMFYAAILTDRSTSQVYVDSILFSKTCDNYRQLGMFYSSVSSPTLDGLNVLIQERLKEIPIPGPKKYRISLRLENVLGDRISIDRNAPLSNLQKMTLNSLSINGRSTSNDSKQLMFTFSSSGDPWRFEAAKKLLIEIGFQEETIQEYIDRAISSGAIAA